MASVAASVWKWIKNGEVQSNKKGYFSNRLIKDHSYAIERSTSAQLSHGMNPNAG